MPNHNINYYQLSAEQTLKSLKTKNEGLSDEEITQRLSVYGENKLIAGKKELLISRFLREFKDLLAILLIVSGALSLYYQDYRSAFLMFGLVVFNALLGFFQRYKAEKVMDSLQSLIEAKAKVIRNGQEIEIEQEKLVPGDIVILEEGDAVPADIRIIQENNLGTNDFALTGESNPSRKFTHPIQSEVSLGKRNNLAFMGTVVATGNATGVVIATGMETEIGRIANLTKETKTEPSPLQKELNKIAKQITFIAVIICAILFVVAILLKFTPQQAVAFAVGIANGVVPEGLPSQVTIALSLAAGRLAKKKAIVKKLSAVETLGATHIICTDKTGTLTKNEMTVQKVVIGNRIFQTSGSGYGPEGKVLDENGQPLSEIELKTYQIFFENGVFASNAKIGPPDREHPDWYSIGDPTEAALINLAQKASIDPESLNKKYPELLEFTFDAGRKRMSSIRDKDGKIMVYVKGAPQSILECCTKIWDGQNIRPITQDDRIMIENKDSEFAMMALRNLGYAYREIPEFKKDLKLEDVEQDLVWLGLAAMIDPPREDVKAAMEAAQKANIRIIIITGDYALTAEAIARKVGLQKGGDTEITVVNGDELAKLSDIGLLQKLIFSNLIFSRTSPEDKLRIVTLLKKAGEVVAVTGDGVNDAPALKKADIGVAMGKTGTEVAKNSAEIVLLDDSFGTLVSAIKEGRTVFHNLVKTIITSLCGDGAELFIVLISLLGTSILRYPIAILPYQVLAIDMVGQMFPLAFLAWDSPQSNIMVEAPRNPGEHIINKKRIMEIIWVGLLIAILAYINFFLIYLRQGNLPVNVDTSGTLYMRATTITYVTIVFLQWMNILSHRAGDESAFSPYLWSNKRLLLGYGISMIFTLLIVYNPFFTQLLSTAPLNLMDWISVALTGIVFMTLREAYKFFKNRKLIYA